MTIVCTCVTTGLRTPHDGDFNAIEIEVCANASGRLYARTDATGDLAYLDCYSHRLWSLNPGLHDALMDRVRCNTLVKG